MQIPASYLIPSPRYPCLVPRPFWEGDQAWQLPRVQTLYGRNITAIAYLIQAVKSTSYFHWLRTVFSCSWKQLLAQVRQAESEQTKVVVQSAVTFQRTMQFGLLLSCASNLNSDWVFQLSGSRSTRGSCQAVSPSQNSLGARLKISWSRIGPGSHC